jgi:hypothetical protein
MTALGCSLLGRLLGADTGHRGPRVACGAGHHAEFVGYRDKGVDTVLGPITVSRAYYHCADCKHGLVPRDAQLGVEATSMSPGLATIAARAGAALPFAQAAALVAAVGGPTLGVKRIERGAEAAGRLPRRRSRPGPPRSANAPFPSAHRNRYRTSSTSPSTAPESR